MSYQVTLQPSGHSFTVEPDQKILVAGLAAGLFMPYSCRSGVCRTCLGKVREGKVELGFVHQNYLSDAE